ncbi:MAG: polyprenyl synthetase family protein [Opitutales bacterium]
MSGSAHAQAPSVPQDLADLYLPMLPALERLGAFLEEQVEAFEPDVRELVTYTLGNQGKRIRSLLLFYSGWSGKGEVPEPLIRAAGVIELVHLATLVHDDILDEAAVRHKQPTVSQKYGPSVAVLLGDALFAHALKLASDFETVEVCRAVSIATRRVCAGEIRQTFNRGTLDVSRDAYFAIIDMKTAELFHVACLLGASLIPEMRVHAGAFGNFGRNLGVAYQIYDDAADLLGSEHRIGKTLGTDIASGKMTLPLILLREREGYRDFVPEAGTAWSSVLSDAGVLAETETVFHRYLDRANQALQPVGDPAPVRKLRKITELVARQWDGLTSS